MMTAKAERYLAKAKMVKRVKFAIFAILLGFLLGTYMGVGYRSAKAMSYNVGQALEMLPMPIDHYQP